MEKKSTACLHEKWTKRHNGQDRWSWTSLSNWLRGEVSVTLKSRKIVRNARCRLRNVICNTQEPWQSRRLSKFPQHIWKRRPAPWLNHSSFCPCTITTDSPTGYCWPIWLNRFKQTFAIPFIITQCSIINAFSLSPLTNNNSSSSNNVWGTVLSVSLSNFSSCLNSPSGRLKNRFTKITE